MTELNEKQKEQDEEDRNEKLFPQEYGEKRKMIIEDERIFVEIINKCSTLDSTIARYMLEK